MKSKSFFTFCILFLFMAFNIDAQVASIRDSLGGAPVPPEIENPECTGINKEPAHATLMPYADLSQALAARRHTSSWYKSLNGTWKFNWVSWPQARPVDFYKTTYDVSSWKEIPVPSNWQLFGYGTPYYRNLGYTFKRDFPKVMSTPPRTYTAYEERNPVGSYRRDFEVPAEWKGRQIFIAFDGVDAGFFLWINGQKVGYSVNSRNVAEKIRPLLPAYMTHGHTGMDMGRMAEIMPYPPNTISMKGATGPFGDYISMGGLFTVVKVRDDLRSYEEDPGWYQHPPGTVALKASDADLARDGINVNEPSANSR